MSELNERFKKWTIRRRNVGERHFTYSAWDRKNRRIRWIVWAPGTPKAASHDLEFITFEGALKYVRERIQQQQMSPSEVKRIMGWP